MKGPLLSLSLFHRLTGADSKGLCCSRQCRCDKWRLWAGLAVKCHSRVSCRHDLESLMSDSSDLKWREWNKWLWLFDVFGIICFLNNNNNNTNTTTSSSSNSNTNTNSSNSNSTSSSTSNSNINNNTSTSSSSSNNSKNTNKASSRTCYKHQPKCQLADPKSCIYYTKSKHAALTSYKYLSKSKFETAKCCK